MQTRHVGNNWLPLLCLAVVVLFAAALSMIGNRGEGSVPGFFIFGTLVTGGVSALWWHRNPSWWLAPPRHYQYLAGGTVAGVVGLTFVPFFNGAGPWLVLGVAMIVFGRFERLRLLVTVGVAFSLLGVLVIVIHAAIWGSALHLLAAALLAFAANQLYHLRYGRRREVQDSDPSFIGSFQEFDEDERVGF